MKIKEQLLSLKPYQPGKSIDEVKKQYGLSNIIKLASNENPFGCSPAVMDSIKSMEKPYALYPDGYATNLRTTLANYLRVSPEQLLFGNGSDEVIQIISRSLLDSNTNTVMATPTFPQYKHNAVIEGAEIREVPLINGEHDLNGMLRVIDDKTSVVWICSPNNPTGIYINKNQILSFLNQVPSHVLVVLDEAYYEYVDASDYYDALELIKNYHNLIVLRTFSKIYGLAGFRLGYGISNPEVIKLLEPTREPFNNNSFAQIAGEAAIGDQEFVETCKNANREGLQLFYQFCQESGLHYYPSQGNFILIDFKVDSDKVFQFLLERGFIVRSGNALGFPTSVRVTIGSLEQNKAVIDQMKAFLQQNVGNTIS
ncbi:histidinol-phosphate transaminase [Neobacillus sp. D3-1R]|uniref:histidinol-phosphate transaminase n=1 Tax=Neobacillus sp. D3-1R TaxID=3445778 RepID=UPI003FA0AA87